MATVNLKVNQTAAPTQSFRRREAENQNLACKSGVVGTWESRAPTAPELSLTVSPGTPGLMGGQMLPPARHKHTCTKMPYNTYSHERLSLLQQPLPSLPSIQRPTRTPVIDVQMDAVPKVSPNLGQTLVQDKDQWLPWPVTKPGRQEGKASKLQLERARLLGDRCAQIHSQINNNGFQQNKTKIPRGYCSSLAVTKCT